MGIIQTGGPDPTGAVDEWKLPGLTDEVRLRIKVALLSADAFYWKYHSPENKYRAVRNAFSDVASILFEFSLLTAENLQAELPLFIQKSGKAGHWAEVNITEPWRIFRSEISDWLSRLLKSTVVPTQHQLHSVADAQAQSRRDFVEPILKRKGWSVLDWSREARVSHATAMDYLDDKTNPFRSTRLKLANALGINPDKLP